jgi:hypothetical protein
MQGFSHDGICRDTSRSSPKCWILLSVCSSKLLELSTGSEKSYSFSCTSWPIKMKEELRGFWLINRKLLGILVYYSIIDLPLLRIKALGR